MLHFDSNSAAHGLVQAVFLFLHARERGRGSPSFEDEAPYPPIGEEASLSIGSYGAYAGSYPLSFSLTTTSMSLSSSTSSMRGRGACCRLIPPSLVLIGHVHRREDVCGACSVVLRRLRRSQIPSWQLVWLVYGLCQYR